MISSGLVLDHARLHSKAGFNEAQLSIAGIAANTRSDETLMPSTSEEQGFIPTKYKVGGAIYNFLVIVVILALNASAVCNAFAQYAHSSQETFNIPSNVLHVEKERIMAKHALILA